MAKLQWRGVDEMVRNVDTYDDKIVEAVANVLLKYAPRLEASAKKNAPWTDRTGNARQALNTQLFIDVARMIVDLILAHGVTYGIWLEVKNNGRYAIIWPTIEAHLDAIQTDLKRIFR